MHNDHIINLRIARLAADFSAELKCQRVEGLVGYSFQTVTYLMRRIDGSAADALIRMGLSYLINV